MADQRALHYAKEAERLLNDDTLAEAMTMVRMKALVALGAVDATDTKEILRLQAVAGCLEQVKAELEGAILAIGQGDGGFDPNQRPAEATAVN